MRGLLSILLVIFTGLVLNAQNLVPNGDFELFSSCPSTYGELDKAVPWNKPNAGSTDYFNNCAPSTSPVSVPVNYGGGYQVARSGGGYVGFTTYKASYPDYREYLQVELQSPLKNSTCYYFEMFLNKKNSARFATDRIGAHIRSGAKISLSSTNLNVTPQIESQAGVALDDTSAWVPIQGYYNAQGGEDHLIIGNFNSDIVTNAYTSLPASTETYAFYFVDDVSLIELDNTINLGPDTLLCSGESLLIDISLPNANYLWSDGLTSPLRLITEPGIYSVKVDIGQCSPIEDSIRVSYISAPHINFGPDTNLCIGTPLVLDAGVAFGNYLWQDGNTQPSLNVKENGTFWVEVENPCGTDTDTVNISFEECENLLFAPNAFTPNGDGINDYFTIKGAGIEAFQLLIFDRWGRLVYTSNEPGQHWDGSMNGIQYPSAVYHWIVTYTGGGQTLLEKENRKSGFVYLLR